MGKIMITLTNEVEQKLRELVRDKYFNKRGAISIIIEKALVEYLSR